MILRPQVRPGAPSGLKNNVTIDDENDDSAKRNERLMMYDRNDLLFFAYYFSFLCFIIVPANTASGSCNDLIIVFLLQ